MKLSYLIRGFPGHPLHPPLTDAAIGAYTVATILAVLSKLGISDHSTATGWWLALVVGLVLTVPTALTGLAEWLTIERRTPLFQTATVFFLVTAVVGHSAYTHASVNTSGLILTLIGFGALTVGGGLGGAIVFTHGMRVLNLAHEPARRAVVPAAEEKELAAKS